MSQEAPTLLLEHHLKALKLTSILREYAAVAAVCRQERGDYATFLLRLTERELIDRERRSTERRIRTPSSKSSKPWTPSASPLSPRSTRPWCGS